MKVDRERFAAWNEEMVQRYDPDLYHQHPSPIVRFIERRRVAAVLHLLDAQNSDAILEVGCGAANVLAQVPRGTLTGMDLSDFILAKARQRMGSRATITKGDAEALPFPDAAFTKVYCTEVLEHLLTPENALREMRRVLKPRGYAVVSIPNEALINAIKAPLVRLGIFRRLLGSQEGAYQAAEKMDDEWHLHAFDLALLREKVAGIFRVTRLLAAPFRVLPLRYAARLDPL